MFTYATCGMSRMDDENPLELHLFSPISCAGHVELLTAVVHYHCTGRRLDLGHTVSFGRPWLPRSSCDHGLISLPYLDGPALELLRIEGMSMRFLWLIPITRAEMQFKREFGLDALEQRFEMAGFDYSDPLRADVVAVH